MGDNIETYLEGIEWKGTCNGLIWLRIWTTGKLL
jgi:hypothetical protein